MWQQAARVVPYKPLWNAPQRFTESYFSRFPGFYETGDAGYIDDGYVFVMARTDDVINVAGHRLPKTRSGKILCGTMRSIADGESWTSPATIDDPATLQEIAVALETLGYPVAAPKSGHAKSS